MSNRLPGVTPLKAGPRLRESGTLEVPGPAAWNADTETGAPYHAPKLLLVLSANSLDLDVLAGRFPSNNPLRDARPGTDKNGAEIPPGAGC